MHWRQLHTTNVNDCLGVNASCNCNDKDIKMVDNGVCGIINRMNLNLMMSTMRWGEAEKGNGKQKEQGGGTLKLAIS